MTSIPPNDLRVSLWIFALLSLSRFVGRNTCDHLRAQIPPSWERNLHAEKSLSCIIIGPPNLINSTVTSFLRLGTIYKREECLARRFCYCNLDGSSRLYTTGWCCCSSTRRAFVVKTRMRDRSLPGNLNGPTEAKAAFERRPHVV